MNPEQRIYRRTPAGEQALASGDAAVPADYRRILALLDGDTHFDVVRGRLRQFSDRMLKSWLAEIEEVGLLESEDPTVDPFDLDFTTILANKPLSEATMIAEDKTGVARDARRAGAALTAEGAYLSARRLQHRAPLGKPIADTIVLIVEDDPDQLALADLRLAMAGYIVRVARTAHELVAELRKDARLDVLLLDVMLPDGNGFDILAKMRSHAKLALLPIVMLTAKDEAHDIVRGLTLGADGYITKPYTKNVLVDTIRRVLKQDR